MSQRAENSVLHRMAQTKTADLGLTQMSVAKALRMAFAKAGDEVLNAAILMRDVTESDVIPENLDTDLPSTALILRLHGLAGVTAIAIVDMQVVGAVIEAQTIGHILSSPTAERAPTKTDAALVAGFLSTALAGFGMFVQDCVPAPPFDGFECGEPFQDVRAAQMAMADAVHNKLSIDLDFSSGAKTGVIHLVMPAARKADNQQAQAKENWHGTLENAVLGTSVRLEAVLSKLKLPLSKACGLTKGDVLTLTGASVDGVTLIGSDGSTVINARLGRSGPVRAVRLNMSGKAPRAPQSLDNKSAVSVAATAQSKPSTSVPVPAAAADIESVAPEPSVVAQMEGVTDISQTPDNSPAS